MSLGCSCYGDVGNETQRTEYELKRFLIKYDASVLLYMYINLTMNCFKFYLAYDWGCSICLQYLIPFPRIAMDIVVLKCYKQLPHSCLTCSFAASCTVHLCYINYFLICIWTLKLPHVRHLRKTELYYNEVLYLTPASISLSQCWIIPIASIRMLRIKGIYSPVHLETTSLQEGWMIILEDCCEVHTS